MKMVVILIYTFSITDPTSVKVTTVFDASEMNTKLRCLRFGCFIDIHIINRVSCMAAYRYEFYVLVLMVHLKRKFGRSCTIISSIYPL